MKDERIVCTWQLLLVFVEDDPDLVRHTAQVGIVDVAVDIDHRLNVVMGHRGKLLAARE
jgi:hypothetical protein